jgi:hypothetical protein
LRRGFRSGLALEFFTANFAGANVTVRAVPALSRVRASSARAAVTASDGTGFVRARFRYAAVVSAVIRTKRQHAFGGTNNPKQDYARQQHAEQYSQNRPRGIRLRWRCLDAYACVLAAGCLALRFLALAACFLAAAQSRAALAAEFRVGFQLVSALAAKRNGNHLTEFVANVLRIGNALNKAGLKNAVEARQSSNGHCFNNY